jgi:hypothetical protein
MKKLLVLSVLLGLLALPMFASDITFGGDATFGFISNFSGDYDAGPPIVSSYGEKRDMTFDVKAAIDDFNSLMFSLNSLETGSAALDKALVTTDLGKWLGLPVGVKVNWGFDDPDWNGYAEISSYDAYSTYLSPTEYWGMDFLISWNMLEFELAMNPGITAEPGTLGYLLAGVAVKEPIKGLNAEVYYFQGTPAAGSAADAFDEGMIAVDAAYSTEVSGFGITAAPGFDYYLSDTAANAYSWYLALKGTYSMFALDTELFGDETDAFAAMDAVVKVSPIDKLDLYGGIMLSFREGDDAFQGADLGVNLKIGAVNGYVGYLITSNGAGEINGYFAPPPDGGFYVAFDVNY